MLSSHDNSLSILCFLFSCPLWVSPFVSSLSSWISQQLVSTALNTIYWCLLNMYVLHTGNARNEYLGMFRENILLPSPRYDLLNRNDSAIGIGCFSSFNCKCWEFSISMTWLEFLFLSQGLTKLYRTLCTSWSPASSKVRAQQQNRLCVLHECILSFWLCTRTHTLWLSCDRLFHPRSAGSVGTPLLQTRSREIRIYPILIDSPP